MLFVFFLCTSSHFSFFFYFYRALHHLVQIIIEPAALIRISTFVLLSPFPSHSSLLDSLLELFEDVVCFFPLYLKSFFLLLLFLQGFAPSSPNYHRASCSDSDLYLRIAFTFSISFLIVRLIVRTF